MKSGIILAALAMIVVLLVTGLGTAQAGHPGTPVTIDGIINDGPGEEWDGHFLGTSSPGDLPVDVFGYIDSGFLYVGYRADISDPDWATTCALSIPPNFYFKTPTTATWPDPAYTLFEMTYDSGGPTPDATQVVKQTDGAGWVNAGDLPGNGVEYAWTFVTGGVPPDPGCLAASSNENMAEFKIPMSLLTYAGDNGKIALFGQYWQYGFGDAFVLDIPVGPPTSKDQCKNDGWKAFNYPTTFKNQGQCIKFVNTGKY